MSINMWAVIVGAFTIPILWVVAQTAILLSVNSWKFKRRKGEQGMKPWAESFYKSRTWQECRDNFLATKFFLCERCDNPADVAHHKTRLTPDNINNPAISLSWDNLESLCQDCHNKEHHSKKTKPRYSFDAAGNICPP